MEGLAFGLIEWLITGAVGGFCGLSLGGIWYLKGKVEDAREEASKATDKVKQSMHELEKKLIAEYASKEDLKEVVRESLAPLKDAITELKGDLRQTIVTINSLRLFGPPE